MTPPETDSVDFVFSRDWTHAGVTYHDGDHAPVAPTTAAMLQELGAGQAAKRVSTRRRRDTADDANNPTGD